ncbi:hypothetical protein B0T25DRAFT_549819 [Lasiosphaeria hispida]|uniref:Uncharacterized protein n=1 Tax=Lasiosphaeria hispida TaxID=260671 RepID=A0AAJ0MD00_9PEZI|nr:hypothetical protein B0T25DRAFT_549819 [Lasiosphaeria hispida]
MYIKYASAARCTASTAPRSHLKVFPVTFLVIFWTRRVNCLTGVSSLIAVYQGDTAAVPSLVVPWRIYESHHSYFLPFRCYIWKLDYHFSDSVAVFIRHL